MRNALRNVWQWIRSVSGDDAYDLYLKHHAHAHPGSPPLTRRAFYDEQQARKWSSVNRCC
jgi:uncharacterized short protein YbdD (DUF466 family)